MLDRPSKILLRSWGVNRTFLVGCLKVLGNQGYVRSKRIISAGVYFSNKGVEHAK
jgi:hypothetical protein